MSQKAKYLIYGLIIISITILILTILPLHNLSNIAKSLFSEETKYNGELLKSMFTLIGGIIIIYGVFLNARRTKALESQNEINKKGEVNERFQNAIEHLGSDTPAITLGGVHVLNKIAEENCTYTPMVFNILCSYIRDKNKIKDSNTTTPNENSIVTEIILDILFSKDNMYSKYSANLSLTNLSCLKFYKKDLNKAVLYGSNLSEAKLYDTNLSGAVLLDANLDKASFIGVNLKRANLARTRFTEAKFYGANLNYSDLTNANLTKARLSGTKLYEANLTGADLSGAELYGAFLTGARLQRTKLNNTLLEGKVDTESNRYYPHCLFNPNENPLI